MRKVSSGGGNIEDLKTLLRPVIESMGYEFVGCEFTSQGHFATLRIYIDKNGGVNADDCGRVSHQISALLDVEASISHQYHLEVSSPGLDRPLFSIEDFRKFIKHEINIHLKTKLNNRANFTGVIDVIKDNEIIINCDGEKFVLPVNQIAKANLVPKF